MPTRTTARNVAVRCHHIVTTERKQRHALHTSAQAETSGRWSVSFFVPPQLPSQPERSAADTIGRADIARPAGGAHVPPSRLNLMRRDSLRQAAPRKHFSGNSIPNGNASSSSWKRAAARQARGVARSMQPMCACRIGMRNRRRPRKTARKRPRQTQIHARNHARPLPATPPGPRAGTATK